MDGRGGEIRTHDLYVPNVALYQAKLRPDIRLAEARGQDGAGGARGEQAEKRNIPDLRHKKTRCGKHRVRSRRNYFLAGGAGITGGRVSELSAARRETISVIR